MEQNPNKESTIPLAEIKLGLNIAKGAYNVLTTDTEEMREIRMSLAKIDAALKSGDEKELVRCNKEIGARHENILLSDSCKYTFHEISSQELETRSFSRKFITLRHIGEALEDSLSWKKFWQGVGEGAKVASGYMIDKQLEKIRK